MVSLQSHRKITKTVLSKMEELRRDDKEDLGCGSVVECMPAITQKTLRSPEAHRIGSCEHVVNRQLPVNYQEDFSSSNQKVEAESEATLSSAEISRLSGTNKEHTNKKRTPSRHRDTLCIAKRHSQWCFVTTA